MTLRARGLTPIKWNLLYAVSEIDQARDHLMDKRTAIALLLLSANVGESRADDEGCTVLLCLSNPAGWSAVAECVAPVQRALKAMAKGRAPQCTFSSGAGGSKPQIGWVPEAVPATSDAPETVTYVRVLEYRDALGVTQRIKF